MRIVRPVVHTTLSLHETVRDLGRLREVAGVLVRHGMGFLISVLRLPGFRRTATTMDTTPERVVTAIQELGPTFVKFGQLLSTRVDIIPEPYIAALQTLQDAVAPEETDAILAQVERTLGPDWTRQLVDFETAPLATGSVAQVHAARLETGEEVVVKVLRPHIRELIRADVSILNLLAHRLLAEFPEVSYFDPLGILKEFERSIQDETDLRQEARHAQRFATNFDGVPEIVIPRVHEAFSGPDLLVMDRVRGVRIREARVAGADMGVVGRAYMSAAYRMIFDHGFFHGDLHPGNVVVLPGDRLALLDFGMVGRFTPEMKDNLVAILFALERGDFRSIARVYYDLGVKTDRVDYEAFERDVIDIMERTWVDRSIHEIQVGAFLKQLADGAIRYRIRAPPNYTMFFKAVLTTEGLAKALIPEVDPVAEARPYVNRLVRERFRPERLREETFYTLVTLRSLAGRVPSALAQLLDDVQQQRLRFEISSHASPEERASRQRIVASVVASGMAMACVVAGSLALDAPVPGFAGLPWLAWVLYGAGGALGAWTLATLLLGRR